MPATEREVPVQHDGEAFRLRQWTPPWGRPHSPLPSLLSPLPHLLSPAAAAVAAAADVHDVGSPCRQRRAVVQLRPQLLSQRVVHARRVCLRPAMGWRSLPADGLGSGQGGTGRNPTVLLPRRRRELYVLGCLCLARS
jgi:hypothetical protein